jgi:hypothetical protein
MIGDKLVLFLVHTDRKPAPKANANNPLVVWTNDYKILNTQVPQNSFRICNEVHASLITNPKPNQVEWVQVKHINYVP